MIAFLRRIWRTAAAEINPQLPPDLHQPTDVKFSLYRNHLADCRECRNKPLDLCAVGRKLFETQINERRRALGR